MEGQTDGVLIDNDSGETLEPHPLELGVANADNDANVENEEGDDANGSEPTGVAGDDGADATGSAAASTTAQHQQAQAQTQTPPARLEDPGEFSPKDYSFDITLADGSKVRIEKPEDFEKIPQDADFGTPKNFMEVQANYSRMVNSTEADKRDYEAGKQKFDDQQTSIKEAEETLITWDKELAYLEGKGKLPAISDQYKTADWRDPEVAKQPGVKERIEVINFMAEENKLREQAGLPPMRSMLEAFSELRNKQFEERQETQKQQQNDARKKRGSMVGGASTGDVKSTPSDMIVGSGGSLRDLGN